jgi:hypothetical protein
MYGLLQSDKRVTSKLLPVHRNSGDRKSHLFFPRQLAAGGMHMTSIRITLIGRVSIVLAGMLLAGSHGYADILRGAKRYER